MSALLWIAIGVAVWIGLIVLVLSLLTMAKRGDEAIASELPAAPGWAGAPHEEPRPPAERGVEATSPWLGQRTADAQNTLGVERIAVVLRDPDDPDAWIVEACGGVRDLCGTMVAVATDSGTAALLTEKSDDRRPWTVASTPIEVDGALVGEVAVATRRARGLQPRDIEFLDRFAGVLAGHVRSRPTRPRASRDTGAGRPRRRSA